MSVIGGGSPLVLCLLRALMTVPTVASVETFVAFAEELSSVNA